MKYYIASRLENADTVRWVRDILNERGHEQTYDWTVHGSIRDQGYARMAKCAMDEQEGVEQADCLIALLPGGRGTHVEIGMALALGKVVYLVGDKARDFQADTNTCAFYHSPCCFRYEHINPVLERMNAQLATKG